MSTQRLTTAELHWAAGFLDGEGAFGWRIDKRGVGHLSISAKQKYSPSLEKLQRLFGGGISGYTRRTQLSIYSWAVASARAAAIMMTLYGLLSPYRQGQIQDALAQWRQYKPRFIKRSNWGKH